MRSFKTLVAFSGALILGGCTAINSSSFQNMSQSYREIVEGYSNDNVLLNIVRASVRMPVTFLEIPSVTGTGSVGINPSLSGTVNSLNPSSALFGVGSSSYSANLGNLTVNNQFSFTQSSMDNAAFMTAFLSTIKVDTVAALTNNVSAPKEVLYSLVMEAIEVRNSKNEVINLIPNNPNSPDYKETFQKALHTLIGAGLSTQMVAQKMVLSPPMDAETVNRQFGVLANAYTQPGFSIDVIKKPGARDMYQAVRIVPVTQFCFNKQLTSALLGHIFSDNAYCSNIGIAPQAAINMVTKTTGAASDKAQDKVNLIIHLRSTRTVFDYLGTLVNLQGQNPPKIISINTGVTPGSLNNANIEYPIFVVDKNVSGKSITSVKYDGDTYSVPSDSKSWTRDVLVTLSELLTLNKVPGAIPASPAVLIK